MGLRLDDDWIWDFWLAEDGDDVHAFFLKAPRALGDPDLRHSNSRVGHAVTRDLRAWELLPDPLSLGPAGAFDDVATWTGCVVPVADGWRMYYTGVCAADARQRVGSAHSTDLLTWEREGVLCESDTRWYEADDWRDPWVFEADGALHMLLCARSGDPSQPADGRGVIGHATSPDGGATWTPQPPLSPAGELRQIEVPQLLAPRAGHPAAPGHAPPRSRWTVIACAGAPDHSAARLARGVAAEWGMVTLSGPGPTGPFEIDDSPFLLGSPTGDHYAGRTIERDGRLWLLAWRMHAPDGSFLGALGDPIELAVGPDRRLAVA